VGSRISTFQVGYHGNGGLRRAWSFFRIWLEYPQLDPKRRMEIRNMESEKDKDSLSNTNERPFGRETYTGDEARQGARLISDLGAPHLSPGWENGRFRRFRTTVSLVRKPIAGETAFCRCGLRVRILAAESAGRCVSCGQIVYPGDVV